MVEVENNVVYVHKMDLVSGQFIGQPWVIDVPGLVSGAAPRLYTNARFANTATPEFPENAIRIEAEDYVDAITDMTVYTIDRGRVVSFRKDQWMLYEVDIPQDGKYQLSVVGSNEDNIIMTVTVDEATSGGGVVPSTGSYNIYKETAIFEFIAAQGIHTIKLSTSEGFSFDYFELVRIGDMADFTIKLEAEMPDAYSTNPFDTSQQRLRAYPRELAAEAMQWGGIRVSG